MRCMVARVCYPCLCFLSEFQILGFYGGFSRPFNKFNSVCDDGMTGPGLPHYYSTLG